MTNKGFVTWFLNISENISVDEHVDLVKKHNQTTIEILAKDGYISILIPCFNESCRVEKTDYVSHTQDTEEE